MGALAGRRDAGPRRRHRRGAGDPRRMPWGPILMVSGVTVLIAFIEKTGGIDLFSAMLASVSTPQSVTAVIAFLGGTISVYSSTSGVVLPAFLPTVPGLVERLGGDRCAAGCLVADRRLPISSTSPRCRPPGPCALPPRTTPTSASCSGRCSRGACRWPSSPRSAATSCSDCCGGKARAHRRRACSSCLAILSAQTQSPAATCHTRRRPGLRRARRAPARSGRVEPLDRRSRCRHASARRAGRRDVDRQSASVRHLVHDSATHYLAAAQPGTNRTAVEERLRDFERALAQPGSNERLQFARRVLPDGAPVKARLLSMIDRSMKEGETHARLIEQAHALGDPSLEFAERSRLYRDRGLASDTSVRINFAIEEALQRIAAGTRCARAACRRHRAGSRCRRQAGRHDFYPPQTIQPFAVIDSLIRARPC